MLCLPKVPDWSNKNLNDNYLDITGIGGASGREMRRRRNLGLIERQGRMKEKEREMPEVSQSGSCHSDMECDIQNERKVNSSPSKHR